MRRATGRGARGFTLVELMVSLIAGTIIAIAVVGLARTATLSFHEQVRLQTVEEELRTASNRLRYDLTKISYMGTGNLNIAYQAEGLVAPARGTPYGHHVASAGANPNSLFGAATQDLQGIQITVNGSLASSQGAQNFASGNGLSPDSILITGNLTTDDEYIGTWKNGAGACGGGQLTIPAIQDPANARLINGNPQNVANAFMAGLPAGSSNARFLVRITDQTGCQHFVTATGATGVTGANAYSTVDLCSPGPIVVGPNVRGNCGVQEMQQLRIAPLHKVRWYLAQNSDPNIIAPPATGGPGAQFMLYRQFLDAFGAALPGTPPAMKQVVAEYGIDLKFGIAVDNYGAMQFFDMDVDTGGGPISTWTQPSGSTTVGGPGPQRVRSVRYRISVRAPIPDRSTNVTPLPGTPYIVRYCTNNPGAACTQYARVRTMTSEVALINQARMNY